MHTRITSGLILALLCACGHDRPYVPPPIVEKSVAAPTAKLPSAPLPGRRTSFDNIDAYKNEVAQHIMDFNKEHTFSGRLPPLLPAVVVVRITVDEGGRVTKAEVQRSRNRQASKVALASMARAGQLPQPLNLIARTHKTLSFSETFLFNDAFLFQLRTLAGPQ